ncbi:DUF1656 domain-containing protein [Methylobacterium sp. yr668]|uniref:DUF1656 domain-containing protein n=1 Tax=Methylobacterium sp. yr668 TaxID=1761801 RepID=UPI0008DFC630|nr:DUF1656 domain-containing protein [Methylobacterium sp. yr668]SFT30088.1 Protein of unknown function [Methylobacterium sp. yr668]
MPLREIDVLGVFIAPFALGLLIATICTMIIGAALKRVLPSMSMTRSPILELALFVTTLSSFVLLLGRL